MEQESFSNDTKVTCDITSNPSKIIKHFKQILNIDGASIQMNLVTMQRTFLLVIDNVIVGTTVNDDQVSKEDIIRGFMANNNAMTGLSLAIGQHSTCIKNSDNALASATLASRLSKKLNLDRPVYVVNNFKFPQDVTESDLFLAKLYQKVFQFVGNSYKAT